MKDDPCLCRDTGGNGSRSPLTGGSRSITPGGICAVLGEEEEEDGRGVGAAGSPGRRTFPLAAAPRSGVSPALAPLSSRHCRAHLAGVTFPLALGCSLCSHCGHRQRKISLDISVCCCWEEAMKRDEKFWFLFLLMDFLISFHTSEAISVMASVSLFYFNSTSNRTVFERCECGVYGFNSPYLSAQGVVGIPVSADHYACHKNTDFTVTEPPWIALIERGNCTFAEKIQVATRRGAAAAVIYNSQGKGNNTLLMAHPGE
ncbi:RING finger protein 148-like [Prinia subflava]|uniref:RING finger protein 148-like n=1 Tax=Prinia subflava TaxID=208062 RepID=UPI002FE04CE8